MTFRQVYLASFLTTAVACTPMSPGDGEGEGEGEAVGEGEGEGANEGEGESPLPSISADTQAELDSYDGIVEADTVFIGGSVIDLSPLSALVRATSISFRTTSLVTAAFPSLQEVRSISIDDNEALTTFDDVTGVIALATDLSIERNDALSSASLSQLASVRGLQVNDNPVLCALDLSSLADVTEFVRISNSPCLPQEQIDALELLDDPED